MHSQQSLFKLHSNHVLWRKGVLRRLNIWIGFALSTFIFHEVGFWFIMFLQNHQSYSQLFGEAKASVKMVPVRLSGKGREKR